MATNSSIRLTSNTAQPSQVKPISERQLPYLLSLMRSRQCSEIERASWTLSLENGMESKAASAIINTLLARPANSPERSPRQSTSDHLASEKQIRYVKILLGRHVWDGTVDFDTLTSGQASALIDELLLGEVKVPEVGEGVYCLDGLYVKVQRAIYGSGKLYTKAFDPETEEWDRKMGLFGKLRPEHKLTEPQAKSFSVLYGRCIRCMAILTDEISIERGIGPICAEKMGF